MHIYFKLQVCIALQEVHPYFEIGGVVDLGKM